jgi:hypothetical protein
VSNNWGFFGNDEFDALIADARTTFDDAGATRRWRAARPDRRGGALPLGRPRRRPARHVARWATWCSRKSWFIDIATDDARRGRLSRDRPGRRRPARRPDLPPRGTPSCSSSSRGASSTRSRSCWAWRSCASRSSTSRRAIRWSRSCRPTPRSSCSSRCWRPSTASTAPIPSSSSAGSAARCRATSAPPSRPAGP